MRPEKQFLVEEISSHIEKSDYLFLANYERANVIDIAELRSELSKESAEFHVVKNNIFRVAAREFGYPEVDEHLYGQNAIIVGGANPTGVAKILKKFFSSKDKMEVKVGVLSKKVLTAEEIKVFAELPSLDAIRAQLLSLFMTPASSMARLLQAKVDKEEN